MPIAPIRPLMLATLSGLLFTATAYGQSTNPGAAERCVSTLKLPIEKLDSDSIQSICRLANKTDPTPDVHAALARALIKSKEYKEALAFATSAAERGSRDARGALGFMLATGTGVTKDVSTALTWLQKAADQRHPPSFLNLAAIYANGEGVQQDLDKALEYYNAAADLNYPPAINTLGALYLEGRIVAKDPVKAASYFRKAALGGDAEAQNMMGFIHQNGLGVKKNEREAAEWYLSAADRGSAQAQYNIAVAYSRGQGIDRIPKLALIYMSRSAKQGLGVAVQALQQWKTTGYGTDSYDDARPANDGFAWAATIIGLITITSQLSTSSSNEQPDDYFLWVERSKEAQRAQCRQDNELFTEAGMPTFTICW